MKTSTCISAIIVLVLLNEVCAFTFTRICYPLMAVDLHASAVNGTQMDALLAREVGAASNFIRPFATLLDVIIVILVVAVAFLTRKTKHENP